MTPGFPSHLRLRHRVKRQGIALVLVLFALVLAVVLVLGLLTHTRSGRQVASDYSNDARTRILADSALNVVMGQIMNATSDSTGTISWADQPGAIRTYNNQGSISGTPNNTSDNFVAGYKLYSASTMTDTNENNFATSDVTALSGWKNEIGLYVNLNQPVYKNGALNYPIADPNANGTGVSLSSPNLVTSTSGVEGFSVNDPDGQYTGTGISMAMPVQWLYVLRDGSYASGAYQGDGSIKVTGNTGPSKANPIVGRVAFWTDDESCKVNINTASEGLYWDTPKVNTLSVTSPSNYTYRGYQASTMASPWLFQGGDSWLGTATDIGLSFMQPGANEFNHFPGHPASTSLSAVFSELAMTPQQIFNIVPRIANDGSQMGTVSVTPGVYNLSGSVASLKNTLAQGRLYASGGEVLFQSNPSAGTPAERPINVGLTEQMVDQRKFFITANSNAPELNLFGRPRIAMWPVSTMNDAQHQTVFDSLVEFCSTINNTSGGAAPWKFYFQRNPAGAYDQTTDFNTNQALYTYLQDVTGRAEPGFGNSLLSKYGNAELNQILTEMLDYVRCTNIFDTSLEGTSWVSGRTMNGEYTNAIGEDVGYGTAGYPGHAQVVPMKTSSTTMGLGRTPTVNEVTLAFLCTADGGTATEAPKGGYNNSNWTLESYRANYPVGTTAPATAILNQTLGPPALTTMPLPANTHMIQAILIVSLANTMEGFPNICPNVQVKITGADQFQLNGTTLFPATIWNSATFNPGGTMSTFNPAEVIPSLGNTPTVGTPFGLSHPFNWQWSTGRGYEGLWSSGYLGYAPFLAYAKCPPMPAGNGSPGYAGDTDNSLNQTSGITPLLPYPFISIPVQVPGQPDATSASGSMSYSGANLTLTLSYANDYNQSSMQGGLHPAVVYQTVNLSFPSGSVPVPCLSPLGTRPWAWNFDGYAGAPHRATYPGRLNLASNTPISDLTFLQPGIDSARSMHIVDGDFRINSGMSTVNTNRFALVGNSGGLIHSLIQPYYYFFPLTEQNLVSQAYPQKDAGFNPFTQDLPFNPSSEPGIPSTWTGQRPYGTNGTGDIDNGTGAQADGPFANFADGGNFYGQDNNPPYFYWPDSEEAESAVVFSPNRQIPSSGMFGSLPTGVQRNLPWQTLHFRPQTSSTPDYSVSAPDHLFMDLFWMPVVQPYAISDTFSTSGKINMNYQIMPFTYINRQTALYAVLKAERMLTIANSMVKNYKDDTAANGNGTGIPLKEPTSANSPGTVQFRPQINIPATLAQFDNRFKNGQIFRSATELCDQYLIPDDGTLADDGSYSGDPTSTMQSYWNNHQLTGDNSREKPYAVIYPRLTTQSNTFRVHYWVESVQKAAANTDPTVFVDPDNTNYTGNLYHDVIRAQKRGNYVIERYLPSDDPRYVTGGTPASGKFDPMVSPLNAAYKIRILSEAEFGP